jgi:hypothetical protein
VKSKKVDENIFKRLDAAEGEPREHANAAVTHVYMGIPL